ncbi:DUF4097 family beta strand repeat-containing protein [Amycolatopsis granulosa]|uniref:DUF4097 family beta strand repeat-containing protein n=1 Tax=Amycolatopsis granulosa TaxID=185684 RepID=UPI001420DD1B|nr:DUF4097 family beta strand repeat-containing protein [Amycolatopsis granulosa]NIH87120.1 hypothetical protein [Amycolatopsis granulosa]
MQKFETPAPISATVDIVFGDIRFAAGDRADTTVEIRPADASQSLDVAAADQVTVAFTDGKLVVRHPKLPLVFTTKFGAVEVLVRLPAGSDVRGGTSRGDHVVEGAVGSCRLDTPAGDIRVERAAEARLKTSGGAVIVDHVTGSVEVTGNKDIRLGRVGGDAVVHNTGRDVWIGEVAGDLRVTAANGDITVEAARSGVQARTANGGIRVGELGGPADLSAATGKVEVGVPGGLAVARDARTSAGRVRNELAGAEAAGRTVPVRVRSHGGDIVVRHA